MIIHMSTVPAFAVIATYPLFCPETDGYMGVNGSNVEERFATIGEAQDYANKLNQESDFPEAPSYTARFKVPHEGETEVQRPLYSLPELAADDGAFRRDQGAPEWALWFLSISSIYHDFLAMSKEK